MFDISNDLGEIHFSRKVIYKICSDAADRCEGDVRIQNYKGRYTTKKSGLLMPKSQNEIESEDIDIQVADRDVAIRIYVVVRFGASISALANTMIDHVYEQMEVLFGVPPVRVSIVVTGIASKTIARRHIEISR